MGCNVRKSRKSRKVTKKSRKMKVVPMGLPGVENVPAPRESIFTLSRGSQRPYTKNIKNFDTNIKNRFPRIFILFNPSLLSADAGLYIA